MPARSAHSRLVILTLLITLSVVSAARAGESAAVVFEHTLAAEGLQAAETRFQEMLADTTGAYDFPGRELVRALPTRLCQEGRRDAALRLLELLEPLFRDAGAYWAELANAYRYAGDRPRMERALREALEREPERPDLIWMLENLTPLLEVARIQIENERAYEPGEQTHIQGPYLGQDPPGTRPEVFAPALLNTSAHEYSISFTPDGREIYFSRGGGGTFVCRWETEGWTAPEPVRFMAEPWLTEEANVAADGSAIFFCARNDLRSPREIWRALRVGGGWGVPDKLFVGMYATSTRDGTLYYTGIEERPDYGILYRRRWTGSAYAEPERLVGELDSEFPDAHPFIAPDESFLLFDSYRPSAPGIFVSFPLPDGTWGEAIRLNEHLGIPPAGQCALSPDGKYLFFCLAGDMYWADARFLTDLRPR